MIILDTDHLTVLTLPESPECAMLLARMEAEATESFATTIVTAEEQMRGWLAWINRRRDVHEQLPGYERLGRLFEFYADWDVVPFDEAAADRFVGLRKGGIRIGSMDLKIASIVLASDALLLSGNLKDFGRVPGLQVESWL